MAKGFTKAERLQEMIWLYLQRGYTDIEMAVRLDVDRTTVYRDRMELEREHLFIEEDAGRYRLDRVGYMPNIKVNLHEALVLYLATRRASHQTQIAQPHITGALEKLSVALKQPMTEHLVRAAGRVFTQNADLNRVRALESITLGWAECRKVDIHYKALKSRETRQHLVHPYLIEPSLWTDGAYLIGFSEQFGKTLTFKIERIEKAELKLARFDPPLNFDEEELLRYAWGIWSSESEPVTVRLRFKPGSAARRMRESVWHKTEKVIEEPDGGLLWEAQIAEWQEMLPWVRGWGADVEVLEPEEMRKVVMRDAQKMTILYQMGDQLMPKTRFFAHKKQDEPKEDWQPLIDHLKNTAQIAREFGLAANVSDLAFIVGLVHDLGKYSDAFQKRLEGGQRVDHSTAGAKELKILLKGTPNEVIATLLAYPITGHHTGLLDYGNETNLEGSTLCARLKNDKIPDYSAYKTELDLSNLPFPQRLHIRPIKGNIGFSLSFLTRMIYSALVDADYQETETYMKGTKPRGRYEDIPTLRGKIDVHLRQYDNPTSDINRNRSETLRACIEKGEDDKPGFFSLTVPTGGGKTLASMAFALHHATKHNLSRIIYVIPFTTIIEQNAKVFGDILGEENVLEHHSNFDWEGKKRENSDDRTNSAYTKLRLASENWDIPIVVTTNVQFFESLFANKSSRCRKLHNVAKSVIIFDEAQMLPREYLRPAMAAVWELVTNYNASVVFCTATQPGLERFFPEETIFKELAPDPQKLFDFYKRVEVQNLGILTDEGLLTRLNAHDQSLCIVNTRRHASGLFCGLRGNDNYHLSTLMCPAHRSEKLEEIVQRLKSQQPCRVVSTTVMEAGIDLDFPVGYRALSGLDSINQAAGRVNREMKRRASEMFVFEPKSEFIKRTPAFLKQTAEVTRMILREYAEAPISIPAIEAFFERLYDLQDPNISFDYKNIMGYFDSQDGKFSFEKAAREFQIIETPTVPLIIPFNEEAERLIEELKYIDYPFSTLRKLQPYIVSIYEGEFDKISSKGVILTIDDTYHYLNPDYIQTSYDPGRGLLIPESGGGDGLLF